MGRFALAGMLALALTLALLLLACGGGYAVARVNEGRAVEGRYVNSEAYAASLEAAVAAEHGDWSAALDALRRARDEDPDSPELTVRLGTALCKLGRFDDAMEAFARALRADPVSERAYSERAACRLLRPDGDRAAAREDLVRAVLADPDALEPALLLVEVDLRDGKLALARSRAEEAAILHPMNATAWRLLVEVAAAQHDPARAVTAASRATALDEQEGVRARAAAAPIADLAAVAVYGLAVRGNSPPLPPPSGGELDPLCTARWRALQAIGAHGRDDEVRVAAEGVRSACPQLDADSTLLEVTALWTPKTAEVVEARAAAAPSAAARRWGARARLRRIPTDALVGEGAAKVLPQAQDRETLALEIAAVALRRARTAASDSGAMALAMAAHDLAPAEPTVLRLVAEVARRAGTPAANPWRASACALARTGVERVACNAT